MISQDTIKRAHASISGMDRHYLTLYACVLGVEAKRVFEFGAGFSTRVILEALEETDGYLMTYDPSDQEISERGPHPRWTYVKQESRKAFGVLPPDDMFDLVLHDGSHKHVEVENDIRNILPHVKRNGLILVHDTCDGDKSYHLSRALEFVTDEKVTFCFGCGLTIIRRTQGDVAINPIWSKTR